MPDYNDPYQKVPDKYDGARFRVYAANNSGGKEVHIDAISICDMMDVTSPGWLNKRDSTWEEDCEAMKAFEKKHDGLYYGRPRESFSVWEAVDLAIKAGKKMIILEDMS